MRFLERERATVEKLLPGLDESLRTVPFTELEGASSPGVRLFRDSGGPGLLVPESSRGLGATALDALRVQRALGSRSPSLAVATAVHHLSMATLVAQAAATNDGGLGWMLVEGVAADNRLMAFGFAEERPGAGILSPSMTAAVDDDGVRIGGVTRAGGLARSMDLLIVSVMAPRVEGPGEELAVALVPADSEGVSVSGAESEHVTLDDVLLAPELLVRASDLDGQLDALLTAGFAWFQLLLTGGYLGAASALVERVLLDDRVPESERVRLLVDVEGAMSAAESIARRIDESGPDESTLADSLYVRYFVQDTISRVTPRAVELIGDLSSLATDEVGYLATCAHGLDLQPPTRLQMTGPLAAYLVDGPLTIA
ncbi:acyl-CoA dehydrogenase [Streptomyces sp. NPDC053750]|uniref:acyl-CoA dehydrogenase n=1 Tax=Streptomyces sp. NPDC053750 TaxID=3365714 RepID=UPI0037CDB7AB